MANPPPLSFGLETGGTSAPPPALPPLSFGVANTTPARLSTPAKVPASKITTPPPLSFGTGAADPYPFNDFAKAYLGHVPVTKGPTDTPMAGGMYDIKKGAITVTGDNPLNLGAEQFNALFAKQKVNASSFNAAWDAAKNSNQDTEGVLAHVDEVLDTNPLYASLTPQLRAHERYGLFGSLGAQGGVSALPEALRPFYANVLKITPSATTPRTPFANTNLGIALNTINPLSITRAAAKVGLSIIQASAATAAAIAPSIVQLFDKKAQGAPLTPFMQRLLGEENQQSFQEMAGHAAANEPYAGEGLVGALANPLAKYLSTSPFAQRLGLDKAAPFLAVGSILGDSVLNLGGFGDLAGDRALVEIIAKEVSPAKIGALLRQNGVDPVIADKMAPHLADMKTPQEVADALRVTQAVQHTSDTVEALHPGTLADEGPFSNPAAEADWEATYQDRYATLNDEVTKLQEQAKTSAAAAKIAAPKLEELHQEGAAIEKTFLEKWVGKNPEAPPEIRAAGPIDVTNMSRADIASRTAELKAGKQGESFGPNDVVRLTDKQTGKSAERIVTGTLPDGTLKVMDDISGIPYKASLDKFDITLVTKGDATVPLPKRGPGINSPEMIALEELQAKKTPEVEERMRRFIDTGRTAKDFLTLSQHDSGDGPALFANAQEATDYVSSVIGRKVDAHEAGIYMREQFDRLAHGESNTAHLEGVNPQQAEKLAKEAVGPLAEKAAGRYWDEVIGPEVADGRAIVIGADDLKDHFGGDYNDLNHPIYSRASFMLYERALKESRSPDVILTGGGAGAGKTEILVTALKDEGYQGIVYDSNMANYDGVVAQTKLAGDAGKKVEVYGILPNLDQARRHTIMREEATGRGISEKTFARGHAGFPAVAKRLIDEGVVAPANMHLLDLLEPKTLAEAKAMAARGDYTSDPVALLDKTQYNEEVLQGQYGREKYTNSTVQSRSLLQEPSARGSDGAAHAQDGADTHAPGALGQERRGAENVPDRVLQADLAAGPPDDPVILVSEADSLSLAAAAHEGEYALRYDGAAESVRDLEAIFADLKGVALDDLHTTLSAEDLANARTELEIGQQVMLDHPGRALMKYVSRETGDLPELGAKRGPNKGRSKSKFAREGDTLIQDLLGQEVSKGGDVVTAQELVDDYKSLKARVDATKANFARIRTTIAAQKQAGTFIKGAQRTIAREVARDTEALRNLLTSAERGGYRRGLAEGSAKGESQVKQMVSRLEARRGRIEALQQQYRLPDRQMRRILGKGDPRFMKADAFEAWYSKLAERAALQRKSLDRYGPLETTGESLIGVGETGDGTWQSLLKGWYGQQGTKDKVLVSDYLTTPEYVLERLGMGDVAEKLHLANDRYVATRDSELTKVAEWKGRAGDRPQANTRIFRWLDGQERFVAHEMSAQELEVAHEVRDYFKGWADRLNLPEDNRIAKYITHLFEPGVNDQNFSMFDDPELAAIMRDKVAGSVYDPFLETRLGKKGYKEDTWGALDAYIKRASRKEAFDPILEQMVEQAKGLDQSVYDYVARLSHGINMRPTETDKLIDNLIIHGLHITRFTDRPLAYLSGKVRQGFYRGTIGLNFASALRNLSQGANTYAKLGEKYTSIGYAKIAWRLAKGDLDELHESGVLADNYIQDQKVGIYKTALQKIDPALYYVFETAEKINRGAAFYGAKAKAAANGLDEQEALAYAKRLVRETQFSFTRVDTPVGLNSDVAKMFVQLQTYNLKQLEFLGRMVRNHEWAGLVRFTVATVVFVETVGKLFHMTLNQVIPSVSVTGSPLPTGVSALFDIAFGNPTNPLDQAKRERNVRNMILSRLPGGIQIVGKTIPGLEAVAAGEDVTPAGRTRYVIPQDFGHYLQAGLFGKSSLSEAQAYYDSLDGKKSTTTTPKPL